MKHKKISGSVRVAQFSFRRCCTFCSCIPPAFDGERNGLWPIKTRPNWLQNFQSPGFQNGSCTKAGAQPNPTQPKSGNDTSFFVFLFSFHVVPYPPFRSFFFLEKKFLSLASRCSLRRCPVSTVFCLDRGSGVPRWSRAKLFSVLPLTFPRNYVPSSRRFLSSSSSRLSLSCKTKKKKKTFPNSQQNPPKPRARRASHTTRPIAIQSTSSHGERRRRRAARGQRAEDGGGRDRRPRPRLVHHGVRVQALPRPPPRRAHPQHRPRARPRRGELRCPGGQGRRGARRGGGPGGGGRGQGGGAGGEGGRGRHDRVEEEEEGDVTFPTGSATKICCELCFVLPNLVLNDAKFSILIPLSAPVVLISAYLCACVSF